MLPRFVTTISRMILGDSSTHQPGLDGTADISHVGTLDDTRRIELLPHTDPEVQQVFIGTATAARRCSQIQAQSNPTRTTRAT